MSEKKYQQFADICLEVRTCERCLLAKTRDKAVPGEGSLDSEILFIGEGPGANENASGRPFVGAAGKFLEELIAIAGFQRQDVFITNVVKCRPPGNRDPLPEELQACGGYLKRQIELLDPLLIITLGRFSMGLYFPLKKISAIHGQESWIDGRMIVPMFHPAAALHQGALRDVIKKDFARVPDILEAARRMRESEADRSADADEFEFEESDAFIPFLDDAPCTEDDRGADDDPPPIEQLSLF